MMLSLDGYFEGPDHDLSWHNVDEEFNSFAIAQMQEGDTILFGRRTYQLMESFWPSKEGLEGDPEVAEIMNKMPKVVVSRTLEKAVETDIWRNVTLIKDNVKEEITKLKNKKGGNIILLGSSNLCVTLLEEGLLDELRIMINPVAIGEGTSLFKGIKNKLNLKLLKTKTFNSGNILLYYNPEH
jgi:dihydrofolate reductase